MNKINLIKRLDRCAGLLDKKDKFAQADMIQIVVNELMKDINSKEVVDKE